MARSQSACWTAKGDVANRVNQGQIAKDYAYYTTEFCMNAWHLEGYFSGWGKG